MPQMVRSFNTETLNGLCSEDQLELLDSIDHLRFQGVDHYISLPQIIVCGDQSSGKSSVLEALSGVPFPVKSNLCTCFPTELVLRRADDIGVTVSIMPEASTKKAKKTQLSPFHEELDGFEGFQALIEKAKLAMGISNSGKAFSKDRLRVEITGPDRPHLTIIDLPGLIHSETKSQSAADVGLVREVVETYMEQPRSIILAVVSAKNDFANQVVLNLARQVDKTGNRTMGVITKPDTLAQGSSSESAYISLARNNQVYFRLGWHVLVNLDSETQKGSSLLSHRNVQEARFFSAGAWKELPPSMLGIVELRKNLSSVLLRQIALELPSLIHEIHSTLDISRELLGRLGEPRRTLEEQQVQLLHISQKFQALVDSSISGTYTGAFFEDTETPQGYQQRIRAVVQNMNTEFADELSNHGHRREISSNAKSSPTGPELITKDTFLDHVQSTMHRTRGRELPGIFSTMVVADLFQQQSSPWEGIVRNHVKKTWEAVETFLKLVIANAADPSIGHVLIEKVFRPALSSLLTDAQAKTTQLLDSNRRIHPITYNRDCREMIQKIDKSPREECSNVLRDYLGVPSGTQGNVYINRNVNVDTLLDKLVKTTRFNTERLAASEALDCMQAYYGVSARSRSRSLGIDDFLLTIG